MNNKIQPSKDNNLIYDVGMHLGEDTAYYLKKGFKVIAFEADPNLILECKNRFQNELNNGKLIIVEGAIVDFSKAESQIEYVSFYKNKSVSVWGTAINEWALRNETLGTSNELIVVPAIDFSVYLERYGIPHYLKIDIEGMDLVCLNALVKYEEKPNYISIESEKVSFKKLIAEFNLFEQLGYNKFQTINQESISSQKEPTNSREGHNSSSIFQEGSSGMFGTDLPNTWEKKLKTLYRYKLIFWGYLLFGDKGMLRNKYLGNVILKYINKISSTPVPGWYDTHARHSTVKSSN
jgi:FkbM family methyltransferase